MGSTFQKTDNTQINKQTNSLSGGDKYHEKNEVDEGEKKNLLGGGWVMGVELWRKRSFMGTPGGHGPGGSVCREFPPGGQAFTRGAEEGRE